MNVVLIGGNSKGYDRPFHPNTLSGQRIRAILKRNHLPFELENMTKNRSDKPSFEEKANLHMRYKDYKVVFLGRFVERELQSLFPEGEYLPHPASRRKQDLKRLEDGLVHLNGGQTE